jgi:hypothetical protein
MVTLDLNLVPDVPEIQTLYLYVKLVAVTLWQKVTAPVIELFEVGA